MELCFHVRICPVYRINSGDSMNKQHILPNRLDRRRYVPKHIDLSDWEHVEPLFRNLLERPIFSSSDLEQYYLDVSSLNSALTEEYCRLNLAISIHTDDEDARNRFHNYNNSITAPASELSVELDNRFLDSPFLKELDSSRYCQLIRLLENNRILFRKENVPLVMEDSRLADQYNALAGGLSVEFDGTRRNLSELSVYLEKTDRMLRERAWRSAASCRLQKKDEFNAIFDQMVQVRTRIANQAGFQNFRDYQHQQLNRFDYAPLDCEKFHRTIEEHAVTLFLDRHAHRRKKMHLDSLRPWDMSVDAFGREPLRPFATQEQLINGCTAILDKIFPDLGDILRLLDQYGHLDLMTRHNKAPVGFNMPFDETGVSFIFMNATGQHEDISVLLHESGHAIETRACSIDPVFQYRHTPQEWGECASQSIELLSLEHLDVFYSDPEDRKRCYINKWESILHSLISTARIDAFQHWVYTHPNATAEDRAGTWWELMQRFPTGADLTGLEHIARWSWLSIPHLYIVPFYYIEYGIAHLGAIQVYLHAKQQGPTFVKQWLDTMTHGYSLSIPALYQKAGLQFSIHGDTAAGLIHAMSIELDRAEK